MKITALVENITKSELEATHGLSLYIETEKHKILFDVGFDGALFENAKKRAIDLSQIDTVIISHGHKDHGGALGTFLAMNATAKIYAQTKAFDPHFNKMFFVKIPIGLDCSLATHPQIILMDGDYKIDDELAVFTVAKTAQHNSPVNNVLHDENGKDDFSHEQNLVITENQAVLIMGCGHCGVVNILEKAQTYHPRVCVGGYHLFNPITKKTVTRTFLDKIAKELQRHAQMQFYTCHCTGQKAYQYLASQMSNLAYLSCGESIVI